MKKEYPTTIAQDAVLTRLGLINEVKGYESAKALLEELGLEAWTEGRGAKRQIKVQIVDRVYGAFNQYGEGETWELAVRKVDLTPIAEWIINPEHPRAPKPEPEPPTPAVEHSQEAKSSASTRTYEQRVKDAWQWMMENRMAGQARNEDGYAMSGADWLLAMRDHLHTTSEALADFFQLKTAPDEMLLDQVELYLESDSQKTSNRNTTGYFSSERTIALLGLAGLEVPVAHKELPVSVSDQIKQYGRPPVEERKEAQQVMLEPSIVALVEAQAKERGLTKSAMLRELVMRQVEPSKTDTGEPIYPRSLNVQQRAQAIVYMVERGHKLDWRGLAETFNEFKALGQKESYFHTLEMLWDAGILTTEDLPALQEKFGVTIEDGSRESGPTWAHTWEAPHRIPPQ